LRLTNCSCKFSLERHDTLQIAIAGECEDPRDEVCGGQQQKKRRTDPSRSSGDISGIVGSGSGSASVDVAAAAIPAASSASASTASSAGGGSGGGVRIFITGAASGAGKSTVCLGLLGGLLKHGIPASELAYVTSGLRRPEIAFVTNALSDLRLHTSQARCVENWRIEVHQTQTLSKKCYSRYQVNSFFADAATKSFHCVDAAPVAEAGFERSC
jgi:hypothetical protein